MQTLTYTTVDKSSWKPGPWQQEPDKMQFLDETTSLPCLINRNPLSGALCGYVGVSSDHPAFGKDYNDAETQDLRVHGGLTFADGCQPGPEPTAICHVPAPSETDNVWWLGFDCAHANDFSPGCGFEFPNFLGYKPIYRDLKYVKDQCLSLAKQLDAMRNADANTSAVP